MEKCNVAVVLAAGTGQRMNQDIPKQFLNIYDKPVIIYTLDAFQKHPEIDAIVVVCLDGWHEVLKAYAKQFNINKLVSVVDGGSSGQESIKRGLDAVKNMYSEESVVLIHDGIRPMLSQEIISDNIVTCKQKGNAITVIKCAEAMLVTEDKFSSMDSYDRDKLMRTQTPQTFYLKDILSAHEEALSKGITSSVASCTLFVELGRKLYFAAGSEKNIKLTTPDDIEIFKALLITKKDEWMK